MKNFKELCFWWREREKGRGERGGSGRSGGEKKGREGGGRREE